ncbi:MAG: hypothetical protein A3J83_05455 [Elusimicrobia bacterium RIFOXYA2_FULL_40_6]|nr:MAG: hypothetical protein A3J83_05455 [Elusimicrobia bacterium RIFOXYA2_FULL_40_6]
MNFKNVLDRVFSQPTKVKLLRFLLEADPGMTGRELSRFCKISHMQVYRCLSDLEEQGIVRRTNVGKSYQYSLNKNNLVVKKLLRTLFETENGLLEKILKELLNGISGTMYSSILFGSALEGKERPTSDVDIFILAKGKKEQTHLKDKLSDIEIEFYEQTGNRLSPLVLTPEEIKNNHNKLLFSEILSGKLLTGRPIKEFLYGK